MIKEQTFSRYDFLRTRWDNPDCRSHSEKIRATLQRRKGLTPEQVEEDKRKIRQEEHRTRYRGGSKHRTWVLSLPRESRRNDVGRLRRRRPIPGGPRTWEERTVSNIRIRAWQKGLPCTIGVEDIPLPEVCPVLGIQLVCGKKFSCENSPTVDRIKGSLGYVPGNVKVISSRANRIKTDATADELEKVAAYARALESLCTPSTNQ